MSGLRHLVFGKREDGPDAFELLACHPGGKAWAESIARGIGDKLATLKKVWQPRLAPECLLRLEGQWIFVRLFHVGSRFSVSFHAFALDEADLADLGWKPWSLHDVATTKLEQGVLEMGGRAMSLGGRLPLEVVLAKPLPPSLDVDCDGALPLDRSGCVVTGAPGVADVGPRMRKALFERMRATRGVDYAWVPMGAPLGGKAALLVSEFAWVFAPGELYIGELAGKTERLSGGLMLHGGISRPFAEPALRAPAVRSPATQGTDGPPAAPRTTTPPGPEPTSTGVGAHPAGEPVIPPRSPSFKQPGPQVAPERIVPASNHLPVLRLAVAASVALAAFSLVLAVFTSQSMLEETDVSSSIRGAVDPLAAATWKELNELSKRVDALERPKEPPPKPPLELRASWWFLWERQLWQVAIVRDEGSLRRRVTIHDVVADHGDWEPVKLPAWDAVAPDGGWVRRVGQELTFGSLFDPVEFSCRLEIEGATDLALSGTTQGSQARILAVLPSAGSMSDMETRVRFFHVHEKRLSDLGAWDASVPRRHVSRCIVTGMASTASHNAACILTDLGGSVRWGRRTRSNVWTTQPGEFGPVDASVSGMKRDPVLSQLGPPTESEPYGERPDFLSFVPEDNDGCLLGWAGPEDSAFVRFFALGRTVSRHVASRVLAAVVHQGRLLLAMDGGQVLVLECQ